MSSYAIKYSGKMICSLETMALEISIPDDVRIRDLKPLEGMLALN